MARRTRRPLTGQLSFLWVEVWSPLEVKVLPPPRRSAPSRDRNVPPSHRNLTQPGPNRPRGPISQDRRSVRSQGSTLSHLQPLASRRSSRGLEVGFSSTCRQCAVKPETQARLREISEIEWASGNRLVA